MEGGDWQPVQEIVRLNFKALHDLVSAHGDALKSVEKAVAQKCGKPELTAALSEKVSVTELTTTFEELSRVIDDKADARDTSALVERMAGRAEVQAALAAKADVSEVQRCLDAKAGASDTAQKLEQLEERAAAAEARLVEVLATKADAATVESKLANRCTPEEVRAIVHEAVDGLRKELKEELAAGLEPKVSKTAVAAALKTKANREDVETLLAAHAEKMHTALSAKADVEAVSTALAAKASRAEVIESVDTKAEEVRGALEASIGKCASAANLAALTSEVDKRVGLLKADLARADEALVAAIGRLDKDLATHAKETGAALASKASTVELQQRARTSEVESMLALKPDRAEIDAATSAVASKLSADLARAAAELRDLVDEKISEALRGFASVHEAMRSKADEAELDVALKLKVGLLRELSRRPFPSPLALSPFPSPLGLLTPPIRPCALTLPITPWPPHPSHPPLHSHPSRHVSASSPLLIRPCRSTCASASCGCRARRRSRRCRRSSTEETATSGCRSRARRRRRTSTWRASGSTRASPRSPSSSTPTCARPSRRWPTRARCSRRCSSW